MLRCNITAVYDINLITIMMRQSVKYMWLLLTVIILSGYGLHQFWNNEHQYQVHAERQNVQANKLPQVVMQKVEADELPMLYKHGNYTGELPFNVNVSLLRRMNLPPKNYFKLSADTVRDFVFVTGNDQSHFEESLAAVASLQKHFPGYKIHYYDLGLTESQVVQVKSFCNVVYHLLDYTLYPACIRVLYKNCFKSIVIQDALDKYNAAFWVDSSFRATRPMSDWGELFDRALAAGGMLLAQSDCVLAFTNYAWTHPDMYKFVPTNTEIQKFLVQVGGGAMLIYNTEFIYREVLYWLYLCSLDDRCCMSTIHEKGYGEFTEKDLYDPGLYKEGRHEQALVNLLMSNLFDFNMQRYSAIGLKTRNLFRHLRAKENVKVAKCN